MGIWLSRCSWSEVMREMVVGLEYAVVSQWHLVGPPFHFA